MCECVRVCVCVRTYQVGVMVGGAGVKANGCGRCLYFNRHTFAFIIFMPTFVKGYRTVKSAVVVAIAIGTIARLRFERGACGGMILVDTSKGLVSSGQKEIIEKKQYGHGGCP